MKKNSIVRLSLAGVMAAGMCVAYVHAQFGNQPSKLNTVKLAFFGCIFATILGVTLGIIRLSGNLLLSRLVQSYVELIRLMTDMLLPK